jgi:chromosomal replication initiator protein
MGLTETKPTDRTAEALAGEIGSEMRFPGPGTGLSYPYAQAAVVGVDPRSPRLSQVLFDFPNRNFASFAALPSNVQAIDAALLFSAGMQPLVALVGPSGWGKSHLLEAVATRLATDGSAVPQLLTATEWALGTVRSEPTQPLLLDNAQDALEQSRTRQAMRLALERRVRAARPTLLCFTAGKASRMIRSLLPQPRSWTVASIGFPEPMERVLVIEQMARVEGLQLSHQLIKIVAFRMQGNGRTLTGALKRLKLFGSLWLDPASTLRACGVLNPFLADSHEWDLGETILRASREGAPEPKFAQDIALYLMLRYASLAEPDAARYAGVEPREAYSRATALERATATDPELRTAIHRAIGRTLAELTPA